MNYSTEEKIKLAKDDSVEKLYESKKNQRTVRVLTGNLVNHGFKIYSKWEL
jgi:hypothetical protein